MTKIKAAAGEAGVTLVEKEILQDAANLLKGGELDEDEDAKSAKPEPMSDIPPAEDRKKASKPAGSSSSGSAMGSGTGHDRIFGDLNKRKAEAKTFHSNGKYDEAMEKYNSCLRLLTSLRKTAARDVTEEEFVEHEAMLYNNIAVCYKQKQEPNGIITYATKALDSLCPSKDVKFKAYKLRAYAYEAVDKLKVAKEDWTKVKELEPGDIDASKALARIQSAIQKDSVQRVADGIVENMRKLDQFKLRGNEFYKASKSPLYLCRGLCECY